MPNERLDALASSAAARSACRSMARRSSAARVSCTGSEFCKLAITETKRFSIRLAQELEERLPGFTRRHQAARRRMPELVRPALDRRRRASGRAASISGGSRSKGSICSSAADSACDSTIAPSRRLPRAGRRRARALERLFSAYVAQKRAGESVRRVDGAALATTAVQAVLAGAPASEHASHEPRRALDASGIELRRRPPRRRGDRAARRSSGSSGWSSPEMAEVWVKLEGAEPRRLDQGSHGARHDPRRGAARRAASRATRSSSRRRATRASVSRRSRRRAATS